MAGLALLLELAAIILPADPKVPRPTLVVEDKSYIRETLQRHKIRFDRVFVPALADAMEARRSLAPHLKHELETARDEGQRERLNEILAHLYAYTWQCGGFEWNGEP